MPTSTPAPETAFFDARRILVTGAGGFIASHLVEALAARGAQVRAFVRYTSCGDSSLLGWKPQDSLEDGLARTIAWVRGNLDQFNIGKYQV